MKKLSPTIKANARALRTNMTDAEQIMWRALRKRQIHGLKFRRQHPIGYYILDFACLEIKLAIEIDGGQHQNNAANDAKRTAWLNDHGWTVLRFWNNQVMDELEAVLAVVEEYCRPPPPS
jgi:very-short-patch-repair endonuclease